MSKAFASRLKSSATLFGETAGRTLQGYEVMNMIVRHGRVVSFMAPAKTTRNAGLATTVGASHGQRIGRGQHTRGTRGKTGERSA